MAYTNIDDPSAHFQTALWTGGNDASRTITNDGNSDLQPDWIWAKARTSTPYTDNHFSVDSSRGRLKGLVQNDNSTETTTTGNESQQAERDLVSFNSDGFTVGIVNSTAALNASSEEHVAWQWKANGGTTSTNTDGDINSTVQVNSDAGFSIVQYSPANATARSIGHGLGATPQVVITRARNRVEDWRVFHSGAGSTGSLTLNSDAAYNSSTVLHTGVTSTTFGVGTDFSVNGAYNYISYVFAEKQGYSKLGKYKGNGSTDGPFIYTGFKPAFILLKQSSNSGNGWFMFDSKRDPDNRSTNKYLRADETGYEGTTGKILDMYSNGFKIIHNDSSTNGSNHTYVYMAFADSPFVTSTGIPATAR